MEWFMILECCVSNVTSLLPAKIKFKMPTMFINWDSWMALVVKNLPTNAGDKMDAGLSLWSGRFPGGGHGNPLQYSCLENNPMDRGAWRATVHRFTESQTRLRQQHARMHPIHP